MEYGDKIQCRSNDSKWLENRIFEGKVDFVYFHVSEPIYVYEASVDKTTNSDGDSDELTDLVIK